MGGAEGEAWGGGEGGEEGGGEGGGGRVAVEGGGVVAGEVGVAVVVVVSFGDWIGGDRGRGFYVWASAEVRWWVVPCVMVMGKGGVWRTVRVLPPGRLAVAVWWWARDWGLRVRKRALAAARAAAAGSGLVEVMFLWVGVENVD